MNAQTMRFGDLLSYPLRSGVTVPKERRGTGIRMINMGELFRYSRLGDVNMSLVDIDHSDSNRYLVEPGDLLFARRSLTMEGAGRCAIVISAPEDTTWESSIIRARLDKGQASSEFYYYLFRSPVGRQLIESIVEQVAVAGVRSSDLSNLRVPYPELHEQHAAAEVLGALDSKIAINERIATATAELADAIFLKSTRSAELVRMSDLMTPILGGTPDRKVEAFWGAGIPWASAKDVGNSIAGVVMDTEEQITDEATRASRAKPMPPRSVLLTARGTVGIVARITQPTAINQSCYAFIPGKMPAAVLFHLVHAGSRHMLNVSHGTIFSTVNMNTLDHVKVPRIAVDSIPDLEGKLAPLHRLIESRLAGTHALAALRDTLLPQLVFGKLRIRDMERIVEDAV